MVIRMEIVSFMFFVSCLLDNLFVLVSYCFHRSSLKVFTIAYDCEEIQDKTAAHFVADFVQSKLDL